MFTNKKLRFIISDIVFLVMITNEIYLLFFALPHRLESVGYDIDFYLLMIFILYIFIGGFLTIFPKGVLFILYPPILEYFSRSIVRVFLGCFVIIGICVTLYMIRFSHMYEQDMVTSMLIIFISSSLIIVSVFIFNGMYFLIGSPNATVAGCSQTRTYRKRYLGIDEVYVNTGDKFQGKVESVTKYQDSKTK